MIAMLGACGASGGAPSPPGSESRTQASPVSSEMPASGTQVESASAQTSEAAPSPGCPALPIAIEALIALDAEAGPLALKFRPMMGVYNERAAACYGDRPLAVRAFVASPEGMGGTSDFLIEPAWIANPTFAVQPSGELLSPPAFGVGPFLSIGVRPGNGDPMLRFSGSWAMVTGHFDDAAAETCRASGNGRIPSVDEAIAICRTTFVLDAMAPTTAP